MKKETIHSVSPLLLRRGIYLLPNLLTTAALFSGFYSVIATMRGAFDEAAIAIFLALIADSLDGRVARMTNTQSEFGVQYDSLSDLISFGIAPACLIYMWALLYLDKLGWLASFLFVAATALRLARFNTQVDTADKAYFQGLPCPAAGAVLASGVWCASQYALQGRSVMLVALVLTMWLAFSMVSNIRFYSFKDLDFKGKVPFVTILVSVLLLCGIALDPAKVLFCLFFCYAMSGPVLTIWQRRKVRSQRDHDKNHEKKKELYSGDADG